MKYNRLGTTELKVSEICLGTMTWGEQNSAADAFAQMDYTLDHGVNFVDTSIRAICHSAASRNLWQNRGDSRRLVSP